MTVSDTPDGRATAGRLRLPALDQRRPVEVDRNALEAFADWLRDEAAAAGGIGPAEAAHVWDRHVMDSLAFAAALEGRTTGRLLDVGSGVGLPGIPLAIAFPEMDVTLLDRSGRRTDLAARAVRVLGLGNVTVVKAELAEVAERFDIVTMRAVLVPRRAVEPIRRVLQPDGLGVVALSRVNPPDAMAPKMDAWPAGVEPIEVSNDVLDSPVWLLTIHP